MSDHLSKDARSDNMSKIKAKDTSPEMKVRRFLYAEGLRYRLYGKLPGKPDIVFYGKKKLIFIHGCFWHLHGCDRSNIPKTNREYWEDKLKGNKKRDKENIAELNRLGWKVLVVWECEINNDFERVKSDLYNFLQK
ncbi:DNA mismatch endonuclease Vsr [Candidatus Dojkabacteria bacterium]|nr:DNA mismatch endonuclease Vsr [Candidatus Dojkabacteria bacterium]